MTIKEIEQMGFSGKQVRNIAISEGFPIAVREGGQTSAIKIDTEEFYKFIKRKSLMYERT